MAFADEIVQCLYYCTHAECDGQTSYYCCDLENSCFDAIFPLTKFVLFTKLGLINDDKLYCALVI